MSKRTPFSQLGMERNHGTLFVASLGQPFRSIAIAQYRAWVSYQRQAITLAQYQRRTETGRLRLGPLWAEIEARYQARRQP